MAHCWAGVGAPLNRLPLPEELPPAAQAVLEALTWSRAIGDEALPGPVRAAVRSAAAEALRS